MLATFGADFHVTVVTNAPGLFLPVGKLHDYLPPIRPLKRKLGQAGVKVVPVRLHRLVLASLLQGRAGTALPSPGELARMFGAFAPLLRDA